MICDFLVSWKIFIRKTLNLTWESRVANSNPVTDEKADELFECVNHFVGLALKGLNDFLQHCLLHSVNFCDQF